MISDSGWCRNLRENVEQNTGSCRIAREITGNPVGIFWKKSEKISDQNTASIFQLFSVFSSVSRHTSSIWIWGLVIQVYLYLIGLQNKAIRSVIIMCPHSKTVNHLLNLQKCLPMFEIAPSIHRVFKKQFFSSKTPLEVFRLFSYV